MHIKVLSLLLVAFVASTFAITHWERDQLGPRRLDNHKRTPQRVRIGSGRAGGLGRGGPGRTGGGGGPLAGQGGAAGPPAAVGAGAGAGAAAGAGGAGAEALLANATQAAAADTTLAGAANMTAGEAVAAAGGNATDDGAGAATTVTVTETVTANAAAVATGLLSPSVSLSPLLTFPCRVRLALFLTSGCRQHERYLGCCRQLDGSRRHCRCWCRRERYSCRRFRTSSRRNPHRLPTRRRHPLHRHKYGRPPRCTR